MANMLKVTAKWAGFPGAPGYSNFYFGDFSGSNTLGQAESQGAVNRVNAFFGAIADRLPPSVNVTVQAEVQLINAADGKLVSAFNVPVPTAIPGTSATPMFSGPTGIVVTWRTQAVRNGRRVRGRTFLVPISSAAYESDGTLIAAYRDDVAVAAAALADASGTPDLGVWARPSSKGATDGSLAQVTVATVPDMVAVLRSRRG